MLCRTGQLSEVQEWVRQGNPVALAEGLPSRSKHHHPLLVAMNSGFHSMVEVLLKAGAPVSGRGYSALEHAIEMGRPDLVRLLIEHGAKADGMSMCSVIEHGCRPDVVDMLLAAGSNLVDDQPIAWGLIQCIRPTLGLLKRFEAEQPELMRQVDLALRYHAKKGNEKWVALTLWAGGDPLARGPDDLDQDYHDDDYPGMNAVELAVLYDRFEVLQQKKMLLAIEASAADGAVLQRVCGTGKGRMLELFLQRGHSPARLPDKGTKAIARVVDGIAMDLSIERLRWGSHDRNGPGDSWTLRNRMGLIHMLLAHGARWLPENKQAIANVRKPLLKLVPAFSMEFAWLMKQYGAARRADVRDLVGSPTMRRHLSEDRAALERILEAMPEEVTPHGPSAGEPRPQQGAPAIAEAEAAAAEAT
ncbi:MAG: ankyrin repeat domain-containing protein [Planctomycetota bacterium]